MKFLFQVVVLAFFVPLTWAAAPIVDFPAACGIAPAEGFYHAEVIVSGDGQQAKVVNYYATLPKQCWENVKDYADDASEDWHTMPVIVVSGVFPYGKYSVGARDRLAREHLRTIEKVAGRIRARFLVLGEVWQAADDAGKAQEGGVRRYTIYLFVPGVSRDSFRRAILPIIAPT